MKFLDQVLSNGALLVFIEKPPLSGQKILVFLDLLFNVAIQQYYQGMECQCSTVRAPDVHAYVFQRGVT